MKEIIIISLLVITSILLLYLLYLIYDFIAFDRSEVKKDNEYRHKKMACPKCGSIEFYELLYTFYVCVKCKSLIDYTPFGLKHVSDDASIRFPEVNDWWRKDERAKEVDNL